VRREPSASTPGRPGSRGLPDHAVGLVRGVKAVDRAVIEAATTGSRAAALRALAIHPLVDSLVVAHRLLDGYQRRIQGLAYLR
jgi:6-phospho-beta-glucosidase